MDMEYQSTGGTHWRVSLPSPSLTPAQWSGLGASDFLLSSGLREQAEVELIDLAEPYQPHRPQALPGKGVGHFTRNPTPRRPAFPGLRGGKKWLPIPSAPLWLLREMSPGKIRKLEWKLGLLVAGAE